MVVYYNYDKFKADSYYRIYGNVMPSFVITGNETITGYSEIKINHSTGDLSLSGYSKSIKAGGSGTLYTSIDGQIIEQQALQSSSNSSNVKQWSNFTSKQYNKGSFIEAIIGTENQYPKNGVGADGYWYVRKDIANKPPAIIVDELNDDSNLFEKSELAINGTISDVDIDDVVTVKYKVNNSSTRNIKAYVSQGTEESFSKVLIYKNGSLYDGSTLVIANLIDGNHTITVWAEDNNGGKSEEHKITIITKRNRLPELIITDYPQDLQGLITTDKLTVTGTATDPDEGAKLIITAQVNNVEPKTIPIEDGEWSFSFAVKQLNEGDNTLTFQVADQYGATDKKQVNLTNTVHASPAPVSIARYQLHPPEPITDIILWIKHKADDDIQVYASFVEEGQADNFVLLQKTVGMSPTGVVESEFIYHSDEPSKNPKIKLVNAQAALMLMGGMSNESKAPTT